MPTTLRKQRAIQAREELILDHAAVLLGENGYLGLNLDELAARIEYAKGTIYLHFASKEDLLLGVVIRAVEDRARLFRHASRYPGLTREKCCAVGIADLILNDRQPHAFEMMQLVSTASVWEKTSQARRTRLKQSSLAIFEPVLGIVREALLAGDIRRKDVPAEHIALGLFTMSKGAMLIQSGGDAFPAEFVTGVRESIQLNRHRFLDGVQWHPLLEDHDYASVERNLRDHYFNSPLSEL
jgi:AcrR family transcriptional regulator